MLPFLFFQTEIPQPEEVVAPEILILTAIFLVSVFTGFFVWLLILRISFFKKAVETQGKIIGLLNATHKGAVSANIPYVGKIESKNSEAAGYLLSIEYETKEYVYQTKSKKTYSNYSKGNIIPVFYNPENPEDCSVGGIYEVNPKLAYGIISIGGIIIISLLVILILV